MRLLALLILLASGIPLVHQVEARPPIRADFFATYPNATGSKLDVLPSNSKHCGVCHFDFNGGGPRNPYGSGIEVGRNNGLTNIQAILAIENVDPAVPEVMPFLRVGVYSNHESRAGGWTLLLGVIATYDLGAIR